MYKKCKYCKKSLYVTNYNKDKKNFCKKECYTKWQKNRNKQGKILKIKYCKYCNKQIPSHRVFCNFIHYNKYRIGRYPHTDKKIMFKKCKCGCGQVLKKRWRKFYSHKCFTNYRKNKTYNKFYGVEKSKNIRDKQSKGNKGKLKGTKHSEKHNKNVSIGTKKAMKNPIVREKLRKGRLKQVFPLRDTSIEISIQKELKKRKIKFKKHYPIIGQPDIFIKPNLCVFCDGDYWHNLFNHRKRDREVNKELKKRKYKVIRFWEYQIKSNVVNCVNKIESVIC